MSKLSTVDVIRMALRTARLLPCRHERTVRSPFGYRICLECSRHWREEA